jgi:hypothetical protein
MVVYVCVRGTDQVRRVNGSVCVCEGYRSRQES